MKKTMITAIAMMLFVGCASTGSGSTEERGSRDMPDWFLKPPTAEDAYYGVGQAKKSNPSLSKKTATERARGEITAAISSKVSTLLKDFMQESGVSGNSEATEFTQSVLKQVSSNTLEGSTIEDVYVAKDNTIYMLVVYSLNSAKQYSLDAAKKEEALYNEFKANQGFDALEKAINDLDTTKDDLD
jgi:hypothetical protein